MSWKCLATLEKYVFEAEDDVMNFKLLVNDGLI